MPKELLDLSASINTVGWSTHYTVPAGKIAQVHLIQSQVNHTSNGDRLMLGEQIYLVGSGTALDTINSVSDHPDLVKDGVGNSKPKVVFLRPGDTIRTYTQNAGYRYVSCIIILEDIGVQ